MHIWVKNTWENNAPTTHELPTIYHAFSHFSLNMHPKLVYLDKKSNSAMEDVHGVWYKASDQKIGLAAPVQKILQKILSNKKDSPYDSHGAVCKA